MTTTNIAALLAAALLGLASCKKDSVKPINDSISIGYEVSGDTSKMSVIGFVSYYDQTNNSIPISKIGQNDWLFGYMVNHWSDLGAAYAPQKKASKLRIDFSCTQKDDNETTPFKISINAFVMDKDTTIVLDENNPFCSITLQ